MDMTQNIFQLIGPSLVECSTKLYTPIENVNVYNYTKKNYEMNLIIYIYIFFICV